MAVWEDASRIGFPRNELSPADYTDVRDQNRTFEGMAAVSWETFGLIGDGDPEQVNGNQITANLFPLLGVKPFIGRSFTPDDERAGAPHTVILSYSLWRRRFGGDPAILNHQIRLDDGSATVIGVMPRNFELLSNYVHLWTPMTLDPQEWANRGSHYLDVIARLKPGVGREQAQADLTGISNRISRAYPSAAPDLKIFVLPMREQLAGSIRPALLVMLAAVCCVLLIACANLANLQLSRGAARHREIAVRTAVGASRWRVIRQLVIESLLLSGVGGFTGVFLAHASLKFLEHLVPQQMAAFVDISIDPRLLAYALALSVLTGLLFGIAPAFRVASLNLSEALKQAGGRSGLARGDDRLRKALVIAEMCMATGLLVAGGLLIKAFVNLRNLDPGFRSDNVLLMRSVLPIGRYSETERRARFYDQVLDRVKALPGVVDCAYATAAPLRWKGGTSGVNVEGRPETPGFDAQHRQISSDYFRAMSIPLIAGRSFNSGDVQGSLDVAIINQTMARDFWQGENPLGKRFRLGGHGGSWRTVVGIAGDVREMGLEAPVKAEMFMPYCQDDQFWCAPRDLIIHTDAGKAAAITGPAKAAVWAADKDQPVDWVQTMDELLGDEVMNQRIGTTLVAAFAALALLLAAIGIYGVLSYAVGARTQEIGVKMALGANRSSNLRSVLADGFRLVGIGAAAGLVVSLILTRLMSSLLFNVSAHDPGVLIAGTAVLIAVSFLAIYIPAWRATRVDPLTAIRYE